MLQRGKSRMIDAGMIRNVAYVLSDAQNLAFADQQFDCVSIGFGLRNVTRIESALGSMFQMLRPGGRIVVLEFSHPSSKFLSRLYDRYSFSVIPRIGRAVTGDERSYRYLVESIRQHPNQEVLRKMMGEAGFEDVYYHNLSGGVVALHVGFRY
jgi:demethylmenaquinone methyltransferase/2-methoxy-6-polyprenyl-1,4-benzoquinol methylase